MESLEKKNRQKLIQDSHAMRIACAIEGSLDHCCVSRRSWASQVYVHSLVIDLGPRTFVASVHLSPFFLLSSSLFSSLSMSSFDPFCSFPVVFPDCFASLVLQNHNVHGRKFIFPPFISLFLFSFSFRFSCEGDLMAEHKTRHQKKWVKAVAGMVTRVSKVFSWRVFRAWLKVWVNGVESNEENALADNFQARLGSSSVFLLIKRLMCDTYRSRDTRQWMLIIISLCSLSLSLSLSLSSLLPLCLPSFLNTWQQVTGKIGQLEEKKLNLEGFNGLCRRSKEDRAKKKWGKGNSTTWKKKQAN